MKTRLIKTSLVVICVIMIVSMLCNVGVTASADTQDPLYESENKKNLDSNIITNSIPDLNFLINNLNTDVVEVKNDSFEIYGNVDMTEKEFRNIVDIGENKVYFHYRTDRRIDLSYDALLQVKTSEKIYSYSFSENESDDEQEILIGIKSFVEKYSSNFVNSKLFELQSDLPQQTNSDIPTTFVDCVVDYEAVQRFGDKGYIVYHVGVSSYRANSTSLLYIVSVQSSFVPGQVARNNGDSSYAKYLNNAGYVHMTVEQAFDRNEEYYYGIRWGNIPYKKDYWPLNEPAVCTISSSLQAGATLGFSFKNGFSKDGLSIGTDQNMGMNISYGYSKSYTQRDPALSVQVDSSNLNKCQWSYCYAGGSYDCVKSETTHLTTYYMFEISNSRRDLFIGDFRLKLDYKFVVRKYLLIANPKKCEFSADLMVRAGELKRIYNFCDGMI